jgi:hypothetical protein
MSEREADAHRATIARRRSEFQDAWGERGEERGTLLKGIRRIANLSKQELRESLQLSGPIAAAMERRIDAVETVDEANELAETLTGDVIAAGIDEWNRICDEATTQYAQMLEPLLTTSENLMPEVDAVEIGVPEHDGRTAETDDHLYDKVRGTFGYSMPMYLGAGLAISIIGSPIAIAAAAGGVLWAVARGWKQTASQRMKSAKNELQRQMRSALQSVNSHFLSVDLSSGRYSRAEEYFTAIETAMVARVDSFVAQRVEDVRLELAKLEAQQELRSEEREAAAGALRSALDDWADIAGDLGRLLKDDRCRPHLAALTG